MSSDNPAPDLILAEIEAILLDHPFSPLPDPALAGWRAWFAAGTVN